MRRVRLARQVGPLLKQEPTDKLAAVLSREMQAFQEEGRWQLCVAHQGWRGSAGGCAHRDYDNGEIQIRRGEVGAKTEIDRLAEWILEHCPEEIGKETSESAVDVAIRLMQELLDRRHSARMMTEALHKEGRDG